MTSENVPVSVADSESVHPVIRAREDHVISRRDIDPDALKVLYRLSRNNYIAYLVGGGVRDLLLGRKPKDFDVSTNARPEQIRALFRNCILIGRRFRLAHVRYGEKIIETSTFRSTPKQCADPADPEADLFQRDDNLFGSPQEDALRRDFTVNGLFYDIESFSIIDYVGGMEDLAARRIKSIGDPCIRFREDPVRMIRAVRFASRLDFSFDPATEDAIRRHGEELAKASPARLLEEITRLFAFSAGEKAVRLLASTGLLRVILPEVSDCLESEKTDRFWSRLRALDRGDTVLPDATPALIFAVLLQDALKRRLERDWSFDESPRLHFDKVHAFLEPLALRLRFPRKLVDRIVHMYITQHRFAHPGTRGKRGSIANFVTQEAFHEALALAEITLSAEGGDQTRLNHWRDMLAERMYGREESQSHAQGHGHNGGNGGGGGGNGVGRWRNGHADPVRRASAFASAGDDVAGQVDEPGDQGVVPDRAAADAVEGADDLSGKKMSRSARRRRNKRMRRLQNQEGACSAAADQGGDGAEESESGPADGEASLEKKSSRRGGRRGGSRARRDERLTERQSSGVGGEQRVEDGGESDVVVRPLTASAFWAVAESESEVEPEPVPEKKRRGRKPRSEGKGGSVKAGASEASVSDVGGESRPLAMDKADEADIPMHWLDEI